MDGSLWQVRQDGFDRARIELNGSKFLLGNGYMGYRGTLEEHDKKQLVACTLAGVYDKVGDGWREPVNAPNGLWTRLRIDDDPPNSFDKAVEEHEQTLDLRHATHQRRTRIRSRVGNTITIASERFLSLQQVHLICLKYTFQVSHGCRIVLETGIDGEVWDINGPHLAVAHAIARQPIIAIKALTAELRHVVAVAEAIDVSFGDEQIVCDDRTIMRRITLDTRAGVAYEFRKYVAVFTSLDGVADPVQAAIDCCHAAHAAGYDALLRAHGRLWDARWEQSDVEIEGDPTGQLALRCSIYHLLAIAPTHTDRVSIPARGLSGQVYKGGVFWDTEIFMLPFFTYADPQLARNLLMYRYHTLDGARRKAKEYGFRGAFYAWESQETGDDACTRFNITDVFTKRPMRTYFRDKQVHISADVAHAVWRYYETTNDESILLSGGAEIIVECARFLCSYAYFKKDKNRYELLDVVGPDEYHERVNNNAYTNAMAKRTFSVALQALDLLRQKHPGFYGELVEKLDCARDIESIGELDRLLFVPQPDSRGVIQQFDGYLQLEDISLSQLQSRIIEPNEYLGGGHGLATTTQIIKQADVVLLLHLFRDAYSRQVKQATWQYYEPRTEHGSSLSACVYALVAADIGDAEWAYKYFMKTATTDLSGDAKQYLGLLYIGGTHPAANGGAWMAAILGFAGLNPTGDTMNIHPVLPAKWQALRFAFHWRGQRYRAAISPTRFQIEADARNSVAGAFNIAGQQVACKPGQCAEATYRTCAH